MRQVEIEIFPIAKTFVLRSAVEDWLRRCGVSEPQIVRLAENDSTMAENLVRLAGKRCYMAFEPGLNPNVTKVREDIGEYIDHILEVKHGSVLEHVYFTFAIEGLSRVCTAELNRHRAGCAISEGSMRYIRFDDIPYWLPLSVREEEGDSPALKSKKRITRDIMKTAFEQAQANYEQMQTVWRDDLLEKSKFAKKKEITSMMRRIVPIGVATGGVWTFNLRALRHVCTMRAAGDAEEEINLVAKLILDHMMKSEIHFFKDFTPDDKGHFKPKHYKV